MTHAPGTLPLAENGTSTSAATTSRPVCVPAEATHRGVSRRRRRTDEGQPVPRTPQGRQPEYRRKREQADYEALSLGTPAPWTGRPPRRSIRLPGRPSRRRRSPGVRPDPCRTSPADEIKSVLGARTWRSYYAGSRSCRPGPWPRVLLSGEIAGVAERQHFHFASRGRGGRPALAHPEHRARSTRSASTDGPALLLAGVRRRRQPRRRSWPAGRSRPAEAARLVETLARADARRPPSAGSSTAT